MLLRPGGKVERKERQGQKPDETGGKKSEVKAFVVDAGR
jgi:hypothetical protein